MNSPRRSFWSRCLPGMEADDANNYRWRYSLRRLLALIALIACLLGGWQWYRGWYVRQEAAIQELALKKLARRGTWYDRSNGWRGWLLSKNLAKDSYLIEVRSNDPQLFSLLDCVSLRAACINTSDFDDQSLMQLVRVAPDIESLVLRRSSITNKGLEAVRQLKSLTRLSLGDIGIRCSARIDSGERWYELPANQFNGDVFHSIGDCRGLQELRVISNSLVGKQMEALPKLTQLKSLVLVSPQLTDESLVEIASLQNLRGLLLGGGNFTSAGMKHLTQLKQLYTLAFKESHVKGSALVHVANLPQLLNLSLENTGIANDDLAALGSARPLERLHLAGSELNNSLLSSLAKCRIGTLNICGTSVNDDGVEMLNEMKHLGGILIRKDQLSASAIRHLKRSHTISEFWEAGEPPKWFFDPYWSFLDMYLSPWPIND